MDGGKKWFVKIEIQMRNLLNLWWNFSRIVSFFHLKHLCWLQSYGGGSQRCVDPCMANGGP
jgi:hypothetical protein